MTWNVHLEIKDGKVEQESVRVSGSPPDGPLMIGGSSGVQSHTIGLSADGLSISVTAPLQAKE